MEDDGRSHEDDSGWFIYIDKTKCYEDGDIFIGNRWFWLPY